MEKREWTTYCGELHWIIFEKEEKPNRPDKMICRICNSQNEKETANLISASPDMYKALNDLVDLFDQIPKSTFTKDGQAEVNIVLKRAIQALNKAEGK
jgi:hypothetical protein